MIHHVISRINAVQSTSRQLWTVVNFFVTVIGAFTFGYFAAHFAGLDVPAVSQFNTVDRLPWISFVTGTFIGLSVPILNNHNKVLFTSFLSLQAVFIGLALAIVVFLADLYFLVKTPSIVTQ